MNKFGLAVAAAGLVAMVAAPALAGGNGNGMPNGAHYNLNIIGVEKGKNADMVGGNGHRIFVKLGKNGGASSQIWLQPGDDFRVCDANATATDSGAYDCDGNKFKNSGATFELPCNTNITDDQDEIIECNEQVDGVGATDLPTANYVVFARALGSPKNNPFATITTCATVQGEDVCSTENTVQTRTKGKSLWSNVTDELTSIVVQYCFGGGTVADCDGTVKTTRIALFSGDTEDWFWDYDNNGLRLLQLRFYEI
jgi:hypothetical protein